jgi:hypothetical protein
MSWDLKRIWTWSAYIWATCTALWGHTALITMEESALVMFVISICMTGYSVWRRETFEDRD